MKIKNKLLLIILMIFLGIFIIYFSIPFLDLIIISALISFALQPVKKKLEEKISDETTVVLLSTLFSFAIIIIFSYFFFNTVLSGIKIFSDLVSGKEEIQLINRTFTIFESYQISEPLTAEGIKSLVNLVQRLILLTPRFILSIFVLLLFTYYFNKNGKDIKNKLESIIPPGEIVYFRKFFRRSKEMMKGVFIVQLSGALSQSFLILVFLLILNVPFAIEFSFLGFILSLFGMSSSFVIIFLIIYYALSSNYLYVIILMVLFLIIINIDDIVKPLIAKRVMNANPLLLLTGIIGGAVSFGATGFIIGPLIAVILQSSIEVLFEENEVSV